MLVLSPGPSWGKVGRLGHTNALLAPSILNISVFLRSVLPTLACQKEHLDLSGVSYFLSQNLAWLPRGVGSRRRAYCCLGAGRFLLCHTTGSLNSNPSRIQARGSSRGPPSPAVLSVTLVLECLCGTKDALFLMGQGLLLGSSHVSLSRLFLVD